MQPPSLVSINMGSRRRLVQRRAPFAGMLHADRSGKTSLALDLMEELRAPAVDRAVLAHVRLGQPVRFEGAFLDDAARRAITRAKAGVSSVGAR